MGTADKSKIHSRPNSQRNLGSTVTGLRETGLETERDGLLYIPDTYDSKKQAPLIVVFHQAGKDAQQGLALFRSIADRTGTILLAPSSQRPTWDLLLRGFGADVHLVDEALSDVFALYKIDPKRIAAAGYMEGASYAISLAAENRDLFTHVIALSPTHGGKNATELEGPKQFLAQVKQATPGPEGQAVSPRSVSRLGDIEMEYDQGSAATTPVPTDVVRRAMAWFLDVAGAARVQSTSMS